MVIRDDPGHRGVSSGISMFDTYQHLNLIFWFCQKKPGLWPQYQVSSRFRTKVTFSLIVVVLCLLQPLHPVVGLQINVRFLKVVSKDSSYLKCCIDTKIKYPARSEPNLQFYSMRSYRAFYNPSTQLLNWGSWKWSQMIPYNQKIWDLTPKSSLQHAQNLIYNFTPWSCPWLPTAPPPCFWPSDWSQHHVNGPKWFPGPKNLGLDTKTNCLAWPRFHLGPQNGDFEKESENFKWVRSWSKWAIFLWGTHLIIYNHRQGMLHGYWQHHVLCIVLQSYV